MPGKRRIISPVANPQSKPRPCACIEEYPRVFSFHRVCYRTMPNGTMPILEVFPVRTYGSNQRVEIYFSGVQGEHRGAESPTFPDPSSK